MNPRYETLITVASTPLAPSSRMVAPTSTEVRSPRRRSLASATRALNVVKLISKGPLLPRHGEGQADPPVANPSDLGHHDAALEQLQRKPFADVGDVRKEHHRARRRDVDELDNVLATAKLEHRSVRQGRAASLGTLVDTALLASRDHCPIKKETRRHTCSPT